jgi:phosphonate transport system substrate-binding protein
MMEKICKRQNMYYNNNKFYAGLLFVLIFSFPACDNSKSSHYTPQYGEIPAVEGDHYVIGVHPLHNPQRLHEIFGPVADLLTQKIDGTDFQIEASRNYAAFDEKLYSGKFAFALPNPYQTILSLKHNYRVFGKMGDDENFRGIILVRKDSVINEVSDLKGSMVSFPAPTALAATMMPQYYLYEKGLDVNKDIKINYVGSQESSIMNVFLGNAAAGATWPPPWKALSKERPQLQEALKVKWETQPLLNNGLVVRTDVPQDIVDQVSKILFDLHKSETGKMILDSMELTRFESASNETYQPVKVFLERFNLKVRKIEY